MRLRWMLGWILCLAFSIRASSENSSAFDNAITNPAPIAAPVPAAQIIDSVAQRIRGDFDAWLEHPEAYRERALKECGIFPEGCIYPFAIPAMAYANLAFKNPAEKASSQKQMRKLLDILIAIVTQELNPPDKDLTKLTHYKKQGTYLSTLNIALGYYAHATGDNHYAALHRHLSRLLFKTLQDFNGEPLASYPEYTWYFDTIMALVSCSLENDIQDQVKTALLLEKHLAWRKKYATHPRSGLPIAYAGVLPRGCDVTMQICLLDIVSPDQSRDMYRRFVKHHWIDRGVVAGFSEWPVGENILMGGDIDSGPVIMGIGVTATGIGTGLVKGYRDETKMARLAMELQALPDLIKVAKMAEGTLGSFAEGKIKFDPSLTSGFLYGDAVLFYALTWESGLFEKTLKRK